MNGVCGKEREEDSDGEVWGGRDNEKKWGKKHRIGLRQLYLPFYN